MLCPVRRTLCVSLASLVLLFFVQIAFGQPSYNHQRIVTPVDNSQLTTLTGNTHPWARAQYDRGPADDATPADRMLLLLSPSQEQQSALRQFLEEQQTPGSANYRHWLTPAEFGQSYGPNESDLQTVSAWLQQQGFRVIRVASARNVIEFSGTAGQVKQTFRTELHRYLVKGKEYLANASDPKIPVALAPVVKGVVSLNNFPRRSFAHSLGIFNRNLQTGKTTPEFTVSNGTYDYFAIGPADFAIIYNTAPLLRASNNGAGQTIALVGLTNINLQDISDFRTLFGLGAGKTSVVLDGDDPGIVTGEETESLLDVEWANAVAPGASVLLVSAQSTATTSGLDLAALHILENNLAGSMSESYGACEAALGTTGNQFMHALWQQAAAQGITVMVSAGDDGSAGCDDQDTEYIAQYGLAVNGMASTPYNIAVGGTDFNDSPDLLNYWNTTNNSTTMASAISYIPEMTWNQTCASAATSSSLNVCPEMPSAGTPPSSLSLWSGSGGASNCTLSTTTSGSVTCTGGTAKPSWQSGFGVPADGVRDVPDVSLYSAAGSSSRSFYVVCEADAVPSGSSCQFTSNGISFLAVGGTSAASPSFAGIVALAEQKAGTRLGNLNYQLYSLAAASGASCVSSVSNASCIFNDVVVGNNSVPCEAGTPNCSLSSGGETGVVVGANNAPAYSAAAGYDLATGLGSVNAANLVTAIASNTAKFSPTKTALTLNGVTTTITAKHGDPISVAVSVTPTASSGAIALQGGSGGFDDGALSNGSAAWTSTLFPGGSYTVDAHYAGDGKDAASDSNGVPVSISAESSRTFVDMLTWDANGNFQTYGASSAPYGSNYILRMEVGEAAATVSSTQGISSKCANHTASCPTGSLTVTMNGNPLNGGTFKLNSAGHSEDQTIQLSPGTYNFAASYPGDASYKASSGSAAVAISKAPTTITATVQSPYQYGQSTQLISSVLTTSNGVAPTGTVTFFDNSTQIPASYYQGSAYSYSGSTPTYATLTANATYQFTSVGKHTITSQYSGDTNYVAGSSGSTVINVAPATPSLASFYSPTSTTPSIPVTISASVTGNVGSAPTGAVAFFDNGTQISGTISYSNPTQNSLYASLTCTFSTIGIHNLSATYMGDTNYSSVSQSTGALTVVAKLPITLSGLIASISPTLQNYPTLLSIQFSSPTYQTPTPTGTIAFYDNGSLLDGQVSYTNFGSAISASLNHSFSTLGTHNITATYSGDSNYAAISTPAPLALSVVSKLTTTTSLGTGSTVVNQPTTLYANVTSNAINVGPSMTGTVTFSDGGTQLPGTATVTSSEGSLSASLVYTFTSISTHNITAQYSGDADYAASQSQPDAVSIIGPIGLSLNFNSITTTGGSGSENLFVSNYGNSRMTVNLTCTPDSTQATCGFSQSSVTLSAGAQSNVGLNYTVPALSSRLHPSHKPWRTSVGIIFAGLIAGGWLGSRKRRKLILSLGAALLLSLMISCGGGSGGNSSSPQPTAKTYKFTVNATSGSNSASQVLTVVVD